MRPTGGENILWLARRGRPDEVLGTDKICAYMAENPASGLREIAAQGGRALLSAVGMLAISYLKLVDIHTFRAKTSDSAVAPHCSNFVFVWENLTFGMI